MNNRTVWIALVVMGLVWVVAQVLLVRVLLVAFHGNELVVGLVLAMWLLGSALGSAGSGRLVDRVGKAVSIFVVFQIFLAVVLPAAVLAGRVLRPLIGLLPGELAGVGMMATVACAVLLPVGAACGGLFAAGCRLLPVASPALDTPVGAVYAIEAAGSVLGGIFATFVLVPNFLPVQVALLASALLLVVSLLLLQNCGNRLARMTVLALLVLNLGILYPPVTNALHNFIGRVQWAPQTAVFDRDSAYGNVTVLAQSEQYAFLVDGVPVATVPVPDVVGAEERAHLPLLFHPAPDTVLLVGGGIDGVLVEMLKHPVRHVDYVELDPLLLEAIHAVGDSALAVALTDPRLRVHIGDGRRFVQAAPTRYDLVMVGVPAPRSLSLNRFYTRAYFAAIRRVLRPGGLLAITCPGSTTFLDEDTRALNAVLRRTLHSVFPFVRAIPGETVLFLASEQAEIQTLDAATLGARFETRDLSARLMSPAHLDYKLDSRRADWFDASLAQVQTNELNTDLKPAALMYTLSRQMALVSPHLHAFVKQIHGALRPIATASLAAVLLALLYINRTRRHALRAAVAIGTTGFAGMTLGIVLLLAYQAFYGALYQQIGLFTAAAALGLAVGGAVSIRVFCRRGVIAFLMGIELGLVLIALLVAVMLCFLSLYATAWGQVVLLVLNVATGALVGAQFPLAARVCVRDANRVAGDAGALYAVDLLGACVGALCVSALLIPVLGLIRTCVLVAIAKLLSLFLFVRRFE